ncbi:MAG: hypothetical protein HQL44_07640 [Alphaproteobacteria bacterium]|nr:hypothetical protein [Alphaproteobacteria bacterium]
MGGFNSVTEALPSGNRTTASGVPLGKAANNDDSFVLPETGKGGNWSGQDLSPSNALTQQMQEVETPAQKPTSALGNGLLGDMGEDDRKLNPIVSTLTKEHPKNPVRLQGGLLGEPSQLQRPVKPPDPFSELGDLPKLRKLWTARRIDSEKRAMHDNWARLINSTQDFGGIIPTFKRHVETNGEDGRADVADMIGRVSQSNPDHARFFQRELATALGGEIIQARRAGEPVENAGLLGDAKSNRFSDPEFEKSYWHSAEAYKADFEKRQREAMKSADEPLYQLGTRIEKMSRLDGQDKPTGDSQAPSLHPQQTQEPNSNSDGDARHRSNSPQLSDVEREQAIKEALGSAWREHDKMLDQINDARGKLSQLQQELEKVQSADPRAYSGKEDYRQFTDTDSTSGKLGWDWIGKQYRGTEERQMIGNLGLARQRLTADELKQKIKDVEKQLSEIEEKRYLARQAAEAYERQLKGGRSKK